MEGRRGLLVAIEGTDSSGKGTQSRMLLDWFHRGGMEAFRLEFPAYDTPWGKEVARYLRGEFGPLDRVPPEIPALLYAGDRYQFRDRIAEALRAGTHVVSDRYTGSNFGYQAAKVEGEAREGFIRWIEDVESRLPPADLVIFLRMPLDVAGRLIEGRGEKGAVEGGGKDIHERDRDYLLKVSEVYESVIRTRENWIVVECARGEEPRTKEDIHGEIAAAVKERLGR